MDSVFAKIIKGEAEASIVYQDDLVTAFMDIEPVNPGHTLVVSNECIASVKDLDDATSARLFNVGKKIAKAIHDSDIPCDGINFYLADGESAGQEVFHVHLHIVPRIKNDGFQLKFPGTGYFQAKRSELDSDAQKIIKYMK